MWWEVLDTARQELPGIGKSPWSPSPGHSISTQGMPAQPGARATFPRVGAQAGAQGLALPPPFCAARVFKGISPCNSMRGFNHRTPWGEAVTPLQQRGMERPRNTFGHSLTAAPGPSNIPGTAQCQAGDTPKGKTHSQAVQIVQP